LVDESGNLNPDTKDAGKALSSNLGSKSQLSIENKLLLYEAIFKTIWTCIAQL